MRFYMNGKFVKQFSLVEKPITQRKWSVARAKAKIRHFAAGSLKVVVALLVLAASALVVVTEAKKTFAFGTDTYERVVEYAPQELPPVLAKICKAESGCNHFDKNGQTLINKSRDVGAYQINVHIWGKKATELGYDLYDEKDNEAFAIWLFENYGSEPWHLSKAKWSK